MHHLVLKSWGQVGVGLGSRVVTVIHNPEDLRTDHARVEVYGFLASPGKKKVRLNQGRWHADWVVVMAQSMKLPEGLQHRYLN
jgi:hypothetical protein